MGSLSEAPNLPTLSPDGPHCWGLWQKRSWCLFKDVGSRSEFLEELPGHPTRNDRRVVTRGSASFSGRIARADCQILGRRNGLLTDAT